MGGAGRRGEVGGGYNLMCRGSGGAVVNREVRQAFVHNWHLSITGSSAVPVWSTGVSACQPVSQSASPTSYLCASPLFVLPICLAHVSPGN